MYVVRVIEPDGKESKLRVDGADLENLRAAVRKRGAVLAHEVAEPFVSRKNDN